MSSKSTLRVMAFSAHGADAADLAGGTLASYVKHGHTVMVVTLSLGAKSHGVKLQSLAELKALKLAEVERAYQHLGIQHFRNLDYDEDPLILGRKEVTDLVNVVREFRPDIVVTHHAYGDTVPDHAETGRAVHHACHCSGRPGFDSSLRPHIVGAFFTYGLAKADRAQRFTGTPMITPDVYIDVTETAMLKMRALEEFATQGFTKEFNQRRLQAMEVHYGLESGVTYAEPFYNSRPLVLEAFPLSKGVQNFGRKVEGTDDETK